jgi:hypothetical protein
VELYDDDSAQDEYYDEFEKRIEEAKSKFGGKKKVIDLGPRHGRVA